MAECCAERGYADATVAAVIARAGVDRESFDSHFSGKEDCAIAAQNEIVSQTLAAIATLSQREDEVARRRVHEVRAVLELIAARPSFARLASIDARQGGTERMGEAYESAARLLAVMLDQIAEAEPAERRTSRAARAALGGIEAVVRREMSAGRTDNLVRLLPDMVYGALVPFVGQAEALEQAKRARQIRAEEA